MTFPVGGGKASRSVLAALTFLLTTHGALAQGLCPDEQSEVQFNHASHDQCLALWPEVQHPSDAEGVPVPLDRYEAATGEFFNLFCHRDPELRDAAGRGWSRDKTVRDTGPFIANFTAEGEWEGKYHGYHAPVVIWYSPAMMEWLEKNRPQEGAGEVSDIPDGAIIAKEMYSPPGARCRGKDIAKLQPKHGIAYMVRDAKAAQDGWYWGYFGFFDEGNADPNIDWPAPVNGRPLNSPSYAGFGQYCVNCHASAVDNQTFSSLTNIDGYPGTPVQFLSHNWILTEFEGDTPEHVPSEVFAAPPAPGTTQLAEIPSLFSDRFSLPPGQSAVPTAEMEIPSQSYDNVWVRAGNGAPLESEFVTSDQCAGCHDAGSTGLSFDMTEPNPHGDDLINLSPYSTWRTSPMGLAGRDPIFFGQLASEEVFHPDYLDTIYNTCFGCHGIMGQRQMQIDRNQAGATCAETVFTPEMVTAIPYDAGGVPLKEGPHFDAAHAKYGALARDGISCTACHRAALTPEQTADLEGAPQNVCALERQQELNVGIGGLDGLARTFTGSYLTSNPDTLWGPFVEPKTKPMQNALGITPVHDAAIASSEQCGTCHTVHLPVLWPKKDGAMDVVADTYEQTTYPEWLVSRFRTGTAAFLGEGEMMPSGAGATPISCAGCHMESHDENGRPYQSKIASIQERSNMPEVENTLPGEEIDLPTREGFARHTLVGLNLFLVKMAQQFDGMLGLAPQSSNLGTFGMPPAQRTEIEMVSNATSKTASIAVVERSVADETLSVKIRVDNKAGHKFPSGVSFRRAFVDFEVMGAGGKVIWQSGKTDRYGVLVDGENAPLNGELWYDQQCTKTVTQDDFQPHYQVISKPEQVQIYQEIKLDPGDPEVMTTRPSCGEVVDKTSNLTTSFLSICHTPKDNRLLPAGILPMEERVAIMQKLGLDKNGEAEKLAEETGAAGVGDDPDYVTGGGDAFEYSIPLSDLKETPISVRATLYYQAIPPFFLQDRFCNGDGANRDRLFHIVSRLDLEGTPIEDWKFKMVSTGEVAVGAY